jgi:hypothetical protein
MPMPPHPPEDHNEPTDGVEAARAYLAGFDDAQNVVDQPHPTPPRACPRTSASPTSAAVA